MNSNSIKYVIFVLLAAFLFGCNSEENQSDIEFVKFFGDGTNDYGIDVFEQNGVIYALSNAMNLDSNKVCPYLYFLNEQGEFTDEPLIFNDLAAYEAEHGIKLLFDDNNDLYIISNVVDADENKKIYVRKVRNKGILWDTCYFENNLNSMEAADAVISDNEIAIIGSTKSSDDLNAYFLKINLDGEFIVQKNIGGNSNDDVATNIISVDGGYIFTGYTESYQTSDISERSTWFAKMDIHGSVTMPKYLGASRFNEGVCIKQSGNSVILASNERKTESGDRNLKVYGVNINSSNLTTDWETELSDTKNIVPADIVLNDNGFIIAANKFSKLTGNICIFYYNIDGSYIAKKELGASGSDASNLFLQVSSSILLDEELLLIGSNEFGENSDIALLKLKSSDVLLE